MSTSRVVNNCPSQAPCRRSYPNFPTEMLQAHPVVKHFIVRWMDHYVSGNLEEAEYMAHAILQNLLMAKDLGGHLYGRLILAYTLEARGDLKTAQDLYVATRFRCTQSPLFVEQHLIALVGMARIAYEQHDGIALQSLMDEAELIHSTGCRCMYTIHRQNIKGLYAMEARQFVQALHIFQPLTEQLGSQFSKMYAKLAIAEIACLQGEPQSAVDQLHELSFIADTGRSAGIFINYQRLFPNAVNIAQERALLFRRGILPNIDKMPTALLGTRDRLVANTFGGCKVSYGRQDIGAFQGLEALTLAYLAMHPNGVSREDLQRYVWVEPVEDDAISRALGRLRAKLPEKALTYDNGIYKCQDHTWCDVLEFEKLWDQAHAMPWEDRFSILRGAAVLYRGAFLNGISNHDWRDEVANKFRKRMGWLKWQLAGLYFRDGQFQEAVTLLEEAMDINPYFSNGMEDLMRVLNHMEEHAQAVHTFNLWAERIKHDLDIDPSDRMNQLKIRIGDTVSDVTRPFDSGALRRAGVRGARTLPRLNSMNDSPPATVGRTWADLQAKMAANPSTSSPRSTNPQISTIDLTIPPGT